MKFTLIQVFRGIAAMLVVMHHLIANSKNHLNYIPYGNFFNFGFVGVDFFFVLSGFIITFIHLNDLKSGGINSVNFFKKRFIRIYPIYWIVAILFIVVYLINTPQFMLDAGMTMDLTLPAVSKMVAESLILLHNPDIRLVGVAWTLSYEILFYIIFGICLSYGFKFAKVTAAIWIVLILLYASIGTPGGVYIDFIFNILILEFLMGCLVAYFVYNKDQLSWKYAVPALLVLFVLLQQTMHINGLVFFRDIVTVTLMGIFFSLITFIAVKFEQANPTYKLPNYLVLIGDASYAIYLSHNMFLSALTRAFAWISPNGASTAFLPLVVTVIFLIAVGLGIVFHIYVERPILSFCQQKLFPSPAKIQSGVMA